MAIFDHDAESVERFDDFGEMNEHVRRFHQSQSVNRLNQLRFSVCQVL